MNCKTTTRRFHSNLPDQTPKLYLVVELSLNLKNLISSTRSISKVKKKLEKAQSLFYFKSLNKNRITAGEEPCSVLDIIQYSNLCVLNVCKLVVRLFLGFLLQCRPYLSGSCEVPSPRAPYRSASEIYSYIDICSVYTRNLSSPRFLDMCKHLRNL